MCGIYGFFNSSQNREVYFPNVLPEIRSLFRQSLIRGSESAGLAILVNNFDSEQSDHYLEICKVAESATQFFRSNEYISSTKKISSYPLNAIIGHTRLATNGSNKKQINNQPAVSKGGHVIGVHNGIITNFDKLHKLSSSSNHSMPELDTQVALDFIEKKVMGHKLRIEDALAELLSNIEGVVNLALLFPNYGRAALITNNGSLYFLRNSSGVCYFASESLFLESLLENAGLNNHSASQRSTIIEQLELNDPLIFKIGQSNPIRSRGKKRSTIIHHTHREGVGRLAINNSLERLKAHTIDVKKIAAIPRCTSCILPVTTPFINFDDNGVCNYCHEHSAISYKGRFELNKILEEYRGKEVRIMDSRPTCKYKQGRPDCLVAFSGGRDSSYGLHLIKNELGMNPIAYTYDWGMISDIGRRNQSRLLQKLGVEHILVSADISMKRRHIRQNILAWMKKPHLGMVPLFMQGDKQCEFYADQIMKKYKIPLMFYCRGNELEKEEFKTGHCGVQDADPGGVIHDLSFKNKLKMLGFYGIQYLKNPAYFNESIFDTALAYFSTYIKPHNYVYLWHFLPWDEDEILSTLTKEYGWELSPETPTSWRIGDGTPAFYNYIYYQVQGFTENDSLRSRQVREGVLSRDLALKLVFAENVPQYANLKWYFDTLELDGDAVLSVVDGMEKLY